MSRRSSAVTRDEEIARLAREQRRDATTRVRPTAAEARLRRHAGSGVYAADAAADERAAVERERERKRPPRKRDRPTAAGLLVQDVEGDVVAFPPIAIPNREAAIASMAALLDARRRGDRVPWPHERALQEAAAAYQAALARGWIELLLVALGQFAGMRVERARNGKGPTITADVCLDVLHQVCSKAGVHVPAWFGRRAAGWCLERYTPAGRGGGRGGRLGDDAMRAALASEKAWRAVAKLAR